MTNPIGQQLGPYQIVEEVGRGGMAVVYKAWQPSLKRHVALKVLPHYFQHDPEFVARFQREAQAAAQLSHPHIIPIYDTGQADGLHFIAMEYLEGGSLTQRLAAGPLGLTEAQLILEQVAEALDYAHQRGFVHRDIKPANILFTQDGQARIGDFGIARAADGTRLTRTGVLLGTPEYMSPEQAEGQAVDHRSDLYALGVVLYQMLTGRVPFQGTTPHAVLHATIYQAPPPPRELNPWLSPAVESVLLKALAKDPGQRFQSGGALAEALRRAQEGVTVEMPRPARRPGEAAPTAGRRLQPRAAVLVIVAVVVLALLGWLLLSPKGLPPDKATATAQALTQVALIWNAEAQTATTTAEMGAPAATATAKAYATTAVAQMGAQAATATAETLQRRGIMATAQAMQRGATLTAVAAATEIDMAVKQTANALATHIAREATQTAAARPTETFTPTPTRTPTPARTPTPTRTPIPNPKPPPIPTTPAPQPASEGRISFYSDRNGKWEIYVMNADGSDQTNLSNNPADDWEPVWSPNGNKIAFVSNRDGNGEIYVMNADGGGQRNLTNHSARDWYPAWSSGGKIAFESQRDGNWEVYVMNADGSGQRNLTNHPADDMDPAWSPDGKRIAFYSTRGGNVEIYVMNVNGSGLARLTNHPADDWHPAWSPRGDKIAFESNRDGNWEIYIMNADGSGVTRLTNHPADDLDPAWSPDGQRIVFSSKRTGNGDIYVMNADGSGLANLTRNPAFDGWPAWSP